MAFEGGVFIDILTRLNMASIDRVMKDVKLLMKEAGTTSGDSFTASFDKTITAGAKDAFDPLVAASDAAFRQMQIGMADLQTAEARINDLRARNYKSTTDQMIGAQRQLDAAIANSQRLMTDAAKANAAYRDSFIAAPAVGERGAPAERKPSTGNNREAAATRAEAQGGSRLSDVATGAALGGGAEAIAGASENKSAAQATDLGREVTSHRLASHLEEGRIGRIAGLGATLGLAGMAAYGVRSTARIQEQMAQLQALQGESGANVGMITPAIWRQAVETGINTTDISKLYPGAEAATNPLTGGRYRGQEAIGVVNTALQLSKVAGISPEDALQGLTTGMFNYRVGPQGSTGMANLLAKGLAGFKGTAADYFEAQHTIDPIAAQAGIGAPEALAAIDVMSQAGQSAQQSGTSFRNLLKSIAAPNSMVSSSLQQLGLNPQDLSVNLNKVGLGATLTQITQAIAKAQFGPNGSVVLSAMANKPLMEQQQAQIADMLSPKARQYIESADFQKSLVSGFKARNILLKAGDAGLSATDMPLIERWLAQQKKIMGSSDVLNRNQPLQESMLAAFKQAFGTQDAAQAALMMAGTPEALQAYKNQSKDLGNAQNNPNAFIDEFKKATSNDITSWHRLGQSLGQLSAHIGNDLLPVIKTVTDAFTSILSFLDKHKTAETALINVLVDLAALWGAAKVKNMFTGAIKSLGLLSDAAGASATKVATLGTDAEAAGTKVATLGTDAEAAGTEMAGSGIGGALKGAAANIAAAFAPAALAAIIGQQVAGPADQWVNDHVPGGNWLETHTPGDLGKSAREAFNRSLAPPTFPGVPGAAPGVPGVPGTATPVAPPVTAGGNPLQAIQGHARGGMIGYAQGTPSVGQAAGQPLMNVPDLGRDSILGLLPNGQPVGLRGGEGILTPEAVQALGGKSAIDSMNNNPWSNPFKVATTFYGSFAKGVAKYSPFGKYLEATSQSLTDLEREHEQATKMQQKATKRSASGMISYLTDLYGATGMKYAGSSGMPRFIKLGRRGSYSGGGGGGSVRGGDPSVMHAIGMAAADAGLSQGEYNDLKWIFSHESGFDPTISNGGGHGAPSNTKAYGLGQFLGHMGDKYGAMGAYSGDPYKETQAAIQYMRDTYGGPAGAKAFWEGHHSYATGGIIPTDRQPAPPPPPGPNRNGPFGTNNLPGMPGVQGPKKPRKPRSDIGHHHRMSHPSQHKKNTDKIPTAFLIPSGTQPKGDRNIKGNPSRQLTAEGKGFGLGGGLLGAAESAAAMGADAFAPGSGQAAQALFGLANRAIGYGGQLLGIGIEGLMETFLPNDSPAADPSKNIFGKIALGIAGAHPSGKNLAGMHTKQLTPKKDLDKGAMQAKQQPGIHVGEIHNHSGDHKETFNAINKAVNFANHSGAFAGQ